MAPAGVGPACRPDCPAERLLCSDRLGRRAIGVRQDHPARTVGRSARAAGGVGVARRGRQRPGRVPRSPDRGPGRTERRPATGVRGARLGRAARGHERDDPHRPRPGIPRRIRRHRVRSSGAGHQQRVSRHDRRPGRAAAARLAPRSGVADGGSAADATTTRRGPARARSAPTTSQWTSATPARCSRPKGSTSRTTRWRRSSSARRVGPSASTSPRSASRAQGTRTTPPAAFRGDDRVLADYLRSEVLARLARTS